jgi:hypothetical protein
MIWVVFSAIGEFGSRQVPFLPWKSISLLTAFVGVMFGATL